MMKFTKILYDLGHLWWRCLCFRVKVYFFWTSPLFVCLFFCRIYVHVHLEVIRQPWLSFSRDLPPAALWQDLWLAWNFTKWASLAGQWTCRNLLVAASWLASAVITGWYYLASLLLGVWGLQTQVLFNIKQVLLLELSPQSWTLSF